MTTVLTTPDVGAELSGLAAAIERVYPEGADQLLDLREMAGSAVARLGGPDLGAETSVDAPTALCAAVQAVATAATSGDLPEEVCFAALRELVPLLRQHADHDHPAAGQAAPLEDPFEAYVVECTRSVARLLFVTVPVCSRGDELRRAGAVAALCAGLDQSLELLYSYVAERRPIRGAMGREVRVQLRDAIAVVRAARALATAALVTPDDARLSCKDEVLSPDPLADLTWTFHERTVGPVPWL